MKRSDLREMDTGLFDDVQINNPDRDKAWEVFIRRKDVAGWAVDKEGFPLNGFYDVWCIAWSKGWDTGADRIACNIYTVLSLPMVLAYCLLKINSLLLSYLLK